MKNIGKIVAISAILGFLIVMVFPVNALPARSAQLSGDAGVRQFSHLDRLEEQGYDMSAVRAAIESGDYETARTLMQQFMEEHKDELPMSPAGDRAGNGEHMSGHLDRLEEQGYDLSEVRAAIESGDYETARTLMQQFMEEHKDELPMSPAGDRAGNGERMSGHLDRLEEQGYDMSEVRAAIESGDYETARTLMQQFMEEHKDELPMSPAGDRAGNGERMSGHLDMLEEQGYDMSEVRAAIESGDYETARTLMQQFMEEHKEVLPVPSAEDRPGNGERMRPGMAH